MELLIKICAVCGKTHMGKTFCSKICRYSEKGKQIIKDIVKETMLKNYEVENPSQLQFVKEKKAKIRSEKTKKQLNDIKNRTKQTNKKRYGVTCYLHCEDGIRKKKKKWKKNYGDDIECPSQSIVVKNKISRTNNKRYGKNCVLKVFEIRQKIEKTNEKIYNHKNPLQSPEIKDKYIKDELGKYYENRISCLATVAPLFKKEEYFGGKKKKYKWLCKKCNSEFFSFIKDGAIPRCLKCFPFLSGTSKPEQELQNWLINHIDIKCDKRFYEKRLRYEIDAFLPSKNIGIELNGIYYHSENSGCKSSNYHLDKTEYFLNKKINILHILDIEWIYKQSVVKSLILRKLDLITNKIDSDECELRKISLEESNKFLEWNHIEGGFCDSNIQLGLFHNQELVSVIALKGNMILRYCDKLNLEVIKSFKKFVDHIQNPLSISINRRFSNGEEYIKYGFELKEIVKPCCWYTNYLKIQKESEKMRDRIWDCGYLVLKYN